MRRPDRRAFAFRLRLCVEVCNIGVFTNNTIRSVCCQSLENQPAYNRKEADMPRHGSSVRTSPLHFCNGAQAVCRCARTGSDTRVERSLRPSPTKASGLRRHAIGCYSGLAGAVSTSAVVMRRADLFRRTSSRVVHSMYRHGSTGRGRRSSFTPCLSTLGR